MSMDILYLDAIVRQLQPLLQGAAVSQVHQPGSSELVLRLWNGRENLLLLLSVAPAACRLHLLQRRLPNPAAPPRFCQLLRSRLKRLLALERLPGERIVRLQFAGEPGRCWTLLAELFGNPGNLILLDAEGRVVDALVRKEEGPRTILPGVPYVSPPTPPKQDLLAVVPLPPGEVPLATWLEQLTPMTPLLAAELAAELAAGATVTAALERFRAAWLAGEFRPCILHWQQRRLLSPFVPAYLEISESQAFADLSAAAQAFYAETTADALFGGGKGELQRLLHKATARLEKRLTNIAAEAARSRDFERQRQLGDLLLAHLHQLKRGMESISLQDWFADPPAGVTIPLDPAKTPKENAEACFQRHRKGKRAQEHIARRRQETREELDWLAGVSLAVEEAEGEAELQLIRQELIAGKILPPPDRPQRRFTPPAPEAGLRRTQSPSGLKIIWGRNNHSNDQVSKHLTANDDLWFHAHNLPGCHLVLKREGGREIPEEDLLFAASLAAGYSRGRHDAKVEVMVVKGGSVRKP
ncbi:MAG: NFACT RNA binding domain-containing protein, partial [Desulfuromonadaceae bacterium]